MILLRKYYLICPYDEKDECKSLGGKWDSNKKKWYIPEGKNAEPFKKWWDKDNPIKNEDIKVVKTDEEIIKESNQLSKLLEFNYKQSDILGYIKDSLTKLKNYEVDILIKKLRLLEEKESNINNKVFLQDNIKTILSFISEDKHQSRNDITNYGGLHYKDGGHSRDGYNFDKKKKNN